LLLFAWRPSVGYYSPLTRIDVLLVGCGLGLTVDPPRWRIGAWVFVASLPLLALRLHLDSPIYFIVVIPFISYGTAAVISECLTPQASLMKTILSTRPLVWVGQRSYGIYLYHLPIFAALEPLRRPNSVENFILVTCLRIGLAMVFAALSYQFLERPILAKRIGARRLTDVHSSSARA
jgi:peptidoglycan/LPS O-acetylase OafA/YrhL